jgi:hypothetical protein
MLNARLSFAILAEPRGVSKALLTDDSASGDRRHVRCAAKILRLRLRMTASGRLPESRHRARDGQLGDTA